MTKGKVNCQGRMGNMGPNLTCLYMYICRRFQNDYKYDDNTRERSPRRDDIIGESA